MKTKEIKHCTMCGKNFDKWDYQENFGMDYYCGYGSKHDEEHIKMNLCCSCFEKVMDKVIPMCKQNPFINDDFEDIEPKLSNEETGRLDRILTILGKTTLNRINETICHTGDVPAYLDLVEQELRDKGYDVDAVPLKKGSFAQGFLDGIEKDLRRRKEESQKAMGLSDEDLADIKMKDIQAGRCTNK